MVTPGGQGARSGPTFRFRLQFKSVEDVLAKAGPPSRRILYIACQDEDVSPVWSTVFEKFMKRVKVIAPLPVALAAMVANLEKPADNFVP